MLCVAPVVCFHLTHLSAGVGGVAASQTAAEGGGSQVSYVIACLIL